MESKALFKNGVKVEVKRYDPCCCMEEYNHPKYPSRYNEGEYVKYEDYLMLLEAFGEMQKRCDQTMEDLKFISSIRRISG